MKFNNLLISLMFISQILSAEPKWLAATKKDIRDMTGNPELITLHRKLKHIKISAKDSESHPVHLRRIIDEALDHGKVTVSMQDQKIKVEGQNGIRFVKVPSDVQEGEAPFTLWYMEHGQHRSDRHYTNVDLPVTFELQE